MQDWDDALKNADIVLRHHQTEENFGYERFD